MSLAVSVPNHFLVVYNVWDNVSSYFEVREIIFQDGIDQISAMHLLHDLIVISMESNILREICDDDIFNHLQT